MKSRKLKSGVYGIGHQLFMTRSSLHRPRGLLFCLFVAVLLALPAQSQSPIDGFNPNVSGTVYATAIQRDGKIIIGGHFTSVWGYTRTNIARLNVDGTQNSFNA